MKELVNKKGIPSTGSANIIGMIDPTNLKINIITGVADNKDILKKRSQYPQIFMLVEF